MRIGMIGAIVVVSLFVAGAPVADETTKKVKAMRLMELIEIEALMDEQKAAYDQQVEVTVQQTLAQIDQALGQLPATSKARYDSATRKFVQACEQDWTTEEAVSMLADLYSQNVTEEQLDGIVAFYESPLGKADVAATRAAVPQWTAHYQERYAALYTEALQAYSQELRLIVQEATER